MPEKHDLSFELQIVDFPYFINQKFLRIAQNGYVDLGVCAITKFCGYKNYLVILQNKSPFFDSASVEALGMKRVSSSL